MNNPDKKSNKLGKSEVSLERRLFSYGLMSLAVTGSTTLIPESEAAPQFFDIPDITTLSTGKIFFSMQNGQYGSENFAGADFYLSRYPLPGFEIAVAKTLGGAGSQFVTLNSYIRQLPGGYSVGLETNFGTLSVFADNAGILGYADWSPGDSGFLGMSFDIDGNTHFGWANITLSNDLTITLHSIGYDDLPGTISVTPVPEPVSAIYLMALGAMGITAYRNRRKAVPKGVDTTVHPT